jgi:hypothetical protein
MEVQHTLFDLPAAGEYEIAPGAKLEKCRSCGASIVWGSTKTGAPIPLDTNHVRIIGSTQYGTTHFATCPEAREWRRR